MNALEQFMVGLVAQRLPAGNTLERVNPITEGRVDALVSHGIAQLVAHVDNPLVGSLFAVARPALDGALVATCGPAVLRPRAPHKRKPVTAKARSVAKRKKPEFTKQGVEIIDAEFVDVPKGGL